MVIWLEFARPRPPQRSAGLWLPPCPAPLPLLTLLQCSSLHSHPRAFAPAILSAHPYSHGLHLEASAPQVLHLPHFPPTLYFTLPYYCFFQSTYHFLTYYQSSISCILYLPHWDVDSWPWAPNSDNRPGVYWCRWCRIRSLGHTERGQPWRGSHVVSMCLNLLPCVNAHHLQGFAERHQHTGL